VSFETAIIEQYRRRESSMEEALIEMYLAGVFVRRVENITEALWGNKVSPATNNVIERLNWEIGRRIRVMGTFPDGNAALMLVFAQPHHVVVPSGAKVYEAL
jgi:transposase-like protein